jgi:septum formation topological specificity factor MinE
MKRRIIIISRRRASTQKGSMTRLKKEVKAVLVVIEKKLSLWQSKQRLIKKKK